MNRLYKSLLLVNLLSLLFLCSTIVAQITPTACLVESFIVTDGDVFTDPGGIGGGANNSGEVGNYPNANCVTTTTICAANGDAVNIEFTAFGVFAQFDWLVILDTNNPNNEVFPQGSILFNNSDGTGDGGADNYPGGDPSIQYLEDLPSTTFTAIYPSGCLTFVFRASGIVDDFGWDGNISLTELLEIDCEFDCNDITVNLDPGACETFVNYDVLINNCIGIEEIYSIPSGTAFGVDTTTVTVIADLNLDGIDEMCSFNVIVNEFPNPITTIDCNPDIAISLSTSCEAYVGADLILEGGPYACYDNYVVELFYDIDLTLPVPTSPVLSSNELGIVYVKVTDPNALFCWGEILVNDNTDPILTCSCEDNPTDCVYVCTDLPNIFAGAGPIATANDACDGVLFPTFTDEIILQGGDCDTTIIERTYSVSDASGNTAECSVQLILLPATVDMIEFPPHWNGQNGNPAQMDCSNYNLNPSFTGVPTINGVPLYDVEANSPNAVCGYTSFYSDQIQSICDDGSGGFDGTFKILRTWTIIEWCLGIPPFSEVQILEIVDNNNPTFIGAYEDLTVGTGSNCLAGLVLPTPLVEDLCSNDISYTISLSSSQTCETASIIDGIAYGLCLGNYTVTYFASDGCGNGSSINFDILVNDQTDPTPICEGQTIVPITDVNPVFVNASTFDDGSFDECGEVTFLVSRMDSPSCGFSQSEFASTVPFYCCDVGTIVTVILQVTDEAGNSAICTGEVEVLDELAPEISAPEDVEYDCSDDNPLENTYFISLNSNDGPPTYLNDVFVGYYTLFTTDNCEVVRVDFTETEMINDCGYGQYTRCFTATDASGYISNTNCHNIIIVNNDPFVESDISWPENYLTTSCGIGLEPTDLDAPFNSPTYENPNCSEIILVHEDLELPVVSPACLKILRTWTVLDDCAFDTNDPDFIPGTQVGEDGFIPGYFVHVQEITVENSDVPILTGSCDDQFYCNSGNSCEVGFADGLFMTATDDCTPINDLEISYEIDLNSEGNYAVPIENYIANDFYPLGTHTIRWVVNDGCGNSDTCVYQFIITDCTPPIVYGLNGLAVGLNLDGTATLWASDFDGGSYDNCNDLSNPQNNGNGICDWRITSPSLGSGQDLNNPPVTTGFTFDCEDFYLNPTQLLDFWVMDCNGNWAYVSSYIILEDNIDPSACPSQSLLIDGTILTEEGEVIEMVTVNLNGSMDGLPDFMVTGEGGGYEFEVDMDETYSIKPKKDINPSNGISTYDLVLMTSLVLGMDSLSIYKQIAADVNKSGTVSSFDMVELRKLILSITTEFANNDSWRFVDASVDLTSIQSLPEVVNLENLEENVTVNFIGIKIGDLNCSNIPSESLGSAERNEEGILFFHAKDQALIKGEEYTIDFYVKDFPDVLGFQFTIDYEEESIVLQKVNPFLEGLTENDFGIFPEKGAITTSWVNGQSISLEQEKLAFSLTFTAKENVMLSGVLALNSKYTRAEAYTEKENNNNPSFWGVDVLFEEDTANLNSTFQLFQNKPNPFKNNTTIYFHLPETSEVELVIFDLTGKMVYSIIDDFEKGKNDIDLNIKNLQPGVLYYQLKTNGYSATRKMILME